MKQLGVGMIGSPKSALKSGSFKLGPLGAKVGPADFAKTIDARSSAYSKD